jgi:hypothetical protein
VALSFPNPWTLLVTPTPHSPPVPPGGHGQGYPAYGPRGYSVATDPTSPVTRIRSSYALKVHPALLLRLCSGGGCARGHRHRLKCPPSQLPCSRVPPCPHPPGSPPVADPAPGPLHQPHPLPPGNFHRGLRPRPRPGGPRRPQRPLVRHARLPPGHLRVLHDPGRRRRACLPLHRGAPVLRPNHRERCCGVGTPRVRQ